MAEGEVGSLIQILQSKRFKQASIIIGVLILLLTVFIYKNPEPFLRLGYIGIFLYNLLGANTLYILPLVIYLNIYLVAFASALGMAGNDSIAWFIGKNGHDIIPHSDKINKIEHTVQSYGVYALFFWSIIPFPYDLVGFVAGYLNFSYVRYIIPTFFGKFIRFILLGTGVLTFFN